MNKIKQTLLLIIFFNIIFVFPVLSEEKCFEQTVCVSTEGTDSNIIFYLKNLKTYDMTITFDFEKLTNFRSDKNLPFIFSVPGKNKIKILAIKQVNKEKSWEYYYEIFWISGSINAKHDTNYIYSLPYASGKTFTVIQAFNGKYSHY